MIALSTITFSLTGHLILQESSASIFSDLSRRVSKTATLDGGVLLTDLGYSEGDREFKLELLTEDSTSILALKRLVEAYSLLYLSCKEGVYKGVIANLKYDTYPVTFNFSIKDRLDG